jgi:D-glycero-alpha-D-manno-heptose 1-phosphate guanylyltransferase
MPITEAIILAGGLGTRLREAVPELPKCMAPVLAKPFIGYLLDYLIKQGVERYIIALGYKSEVIEQYLNTQYGNLEIIYSVEKEPLGTGGAIRLAGKHVTSNDALVLNGDTFYKVDVLALSSFQNKSKADCTLSLKPMNNFDRYGVVQLKEDQSVGSFKEKQFYETGLINAGAYALNVKNFLQLNMAEKFSFEKDYLEATYPQKRLFGFVQDAYFIDIGIPSDFERAQTELILNL